jgi:hypothetical protein
MFGPEGSQHSCDKDCGSSRSSSDRLSARVRDRQVVRCELPATQLCDRIGKSGHERSRSRFSSVDVRPDPPLGALCFGYAAKLHQIAPTSIFDLSVKRHTEWSRIDACGVACDQIRGQMANAGAGAKAVSRTARGDEHSADAAHR